MRILIFNWRDIRNSWAGGSEVYIHEIAKRLVAKGNQVTLFCAQDPATKLPDEETIDGVKVIRKGGRFSIYLWAPIYYFRKLRKETDVIIDAQNGIPFFTPLFSLRKKKVSLVFHVHGKQFFYELPFPINLAGYILEKYFFSFIYGRQKIIAISKTTKEELLKIGFKAKKINLVYVGIDKIKNSKGIKKFSKPTLIYLGRIKKYKRVNLLIKLMPEILKKVPNARLLIAGWGTEGGVLTDIVMRGNVRKHVDILGPVSNMEKRNLLSRSWLFVNPSIHEGWSISVLEANLYGTPAIAFRVPGLSESIVDGKTGALCDDEKGFVDCISKLLSNEKKRKQFGENAKKWATNFNWDESTDLFLNTLEKS
jgi:glycosyltransferase involved in cell wall biosynthesis